MSAGLEELLHLVQLYRKLSTATKPEPPGLAAASLATLDSALELLWGQFPALVKETQSEVRRARSYSNSVRVLVGAACGLGHLAWNMEHLTGDFMKAFETKIEAPWSRRGRDAHLMRKRRASRWDNDLPLEVEVAEEANEYKVEMSTDEQPNASEEKYRLTEEISNEEEVKNAGDRMKRSSESSRNILVQVLTLLGLNGWGASYSLLNFLLLEPQPECGLQELALLLDSYRELASLPRVLERVGKLPALWMSSCKIAGSVDVTSVYAVQAVKAWHLTEFLAGGGR